MRALVPGRVAGEVIVLEESLSFWGGYDPVSGFIIDGAHPQHGETLAGKIVVMPHGRGSSSASSVLAEALRLGTGPAGLVLDEPDQILVIGSLVARLLYGVECPIYVGQVEEMSGDRIELGEK
ncbi:MAG: DUF126 domain-containing protein [Acidimicrobiia bacterium]